MVVVVVVGVEGVKEGGEKEKKITPVFTSVVQPSIHLNSLYSLLPSKSSSWGFFS